MSMNTGLQIKPIEPEHFVFGDARLGDQPVLTDGDWSSFLPIPEDQAPFGFEPMCCTTFALLNCVEIMLRQKYGATDNYSDKFLAYVSGTTKSGNDPHTVAEALRTKGDVYEADYQYTSSDNSWEKFYAVPEKWLYTKALEFIAQYNFGHSWVSPVSQQAMMNALNYSPLTAGVYAWELDPQTGYYTNKQNLPAEHDVCVYGYVQGQYWKIFDSYSQECKKLAWDFPFVAVKRYTLDRQVVSPTAWDTFLRWMSQVIDDFKRSMNVGDYSPERTLGAERSSQWSSFKVQFAKTHPKVCAVCGTTKGLQLHHKTPFSRDKSRELDPTNVVWLCEQGEHSCHLIFGHLYSFFSYNLDLDNTIKEWNVLITNRPTKL